MARNYDEEFRLERAKKMDRARIAKGFSNIELARRAGYDEKTVRKVLAGQATRDKTIVEICQVLGIEPELVNTIEEVDVADDVFGAYTRSTHRGYEGYFHLFRPSFTTPGAIFRGVVQIRWDPNEDVFQFSEFYSVDDATGEPKAHSGNVCISSYTNLLHLTTMFEGSVRLVTLTKLREGEGIMRGTMQTQAETLTFFQPTVSPVVLRKIKTYDPASIIGDLGFVEQGSPDWVFADKQISLTENQILKVVSWSSPKAQPARRSTD